MAQNSQALANDTPAAVPARGILVVDDDCSVRRVMVSALTSAGFSVYEAADGPGAIASFQRLTGCIDLVVCDIQMPGMTGPEAARHLLSFKPSTRVLFISGAAPDLLLEWNKGPVNFLAKPFGLEQFLQAVNRLIEEIERQPRP